MKIKLFYHSLLSDWNHGNAHFLRGLVTELLAMGHEVEVFEERNNWSLSNLRNHVPDGGEEFHKYYPSLQSTFYSTSAFDPSEILADADLVIVHEWNDWELVRTIGEYRSENPHFKLLFHDTHHRSVSCREDMAHYDLRHYDGVLAFGEVIKDIYLKEGWCSRAWVWHEAADTRIFTPERSAPMKGDLVWIGNWGDEERTAEISEFLIEPVRELGLQARIYGVRYPPEAIRKLEAAGIEYGGYLPNYKVPEVFRRYRLTLHIPRRPYAEDLPGIPTIRPFEAMACGIPLISAPWNDTEELFHYGADYLSVSNKEEMKNTMMKVLTDNEMATSLAVNGLNTILNRHTCRHRAEELMEICNELNMQEQKGVVFTEKARAV